MFKFIRSYYLYVYYWFSVKATPENRKPEPHGGFIIMSLFVIPVQLMAVVFYSGWLYEPVLGFVHETLGAELFEFRGPISNFMVLIFLFSAVVTYLICCKGIKYEEIPKRLETHPTLSEFSVGKAMIMILFNVVLIFIHLFIS